MKKIWKVWTVILVVAATVLLTISTQYSKKEEISTDSYQYLIGVSLPNVIEPWLNNFVDVFTEKVSQDKKINVIFRDAAGNPEKQIQDIETLMEYGIDILIVSPDGSDSLPIMSSPKVLILRAFSLNITSQNRAKGVRQSSYPVLNSHKRV